jgi:hypothetical protein
MNAARDAARAVLDCLDWARLGDVYFHEDGEQELRERRKAILGCGMTLAELLLPQLPKVGASLWVGAGVAELPVLLAEAMRGGRRVVAANLRAEECAILNKALVIAAPHVALRYEAVDARVAAPEATFDHLGCVSLFTDPESWPLLSDVAYGRIAPVQIDVEQFVAERDSARELATTLFARLRRPGLVTTTAEEVSWFLEQADAVGAEIEAGEELVEAAIVGDPIGVLRIR